MRGFDRVRGSENNSGMGNAPWPTEVAAGIPDNDEKSAHRACLGEYMNKREFLKAAAAHERVID